MFYPKEITTDHEQYKKDNMPCPNCYQFSVYIVEIDYEMNEGSTYESKACICCNHYFPEIIEDNLEERIVYKLTHSPNCPLINIMREIALN